VPGKKSVRLSGLFEYAVKRCRRKHEDTKKCQSGRCGKSLWWIQQLDYYLINFFQWRL